MVTEVPSLGALLMAMEPPCSSMIFFTVARPRPVPARFVVKNGSNTLSTISAGIGAPCGRDVRRRRQRLLDHVGMRRRRLERATRKHRCNEKKGGAHQPENGYSQLYQVYERIAIFRSTMNGLFGLV